jgi:acyl-CoA reductase-like NAD-dependent aldehyde dehydrogenase
MVRQSTKPEAAAYPESPRSATQERAATAQPAWPRTQKSRLSILPKVNNEGNEAKEDNSDIFTRENFRARFAANADGLFTTILSIIQEHDSLLEELNTLYIETNI